MADLGLVHLELRDEIRHAELALHEDAQDADAVRVGQRLEAPRHPGRLSIQHRRIDSPGTAAAGLPTR